MKVLCYAQIAKKKLSDANWKYTDDIREVKKLSERGHNFTEIEKEIRQPTAE
jgi:hypothetical protein